jgi:hypothetical protein
MGKMGGKGGEASWQTSNSEKKRNEMKGYIVTDRMEVEWKGGKVESNREFWY